MTPNRFNEIVKNRASQRVKQKVAKFEATVAKAFEELHPCLKTNNGYKWFGGEAAKHAQAVMRHLLGLRGDVKKSAGYPAQLWSDEEDKVQEELLATMDEMAKALLAAPDTEPQPIALDAPPGTTHEEI
jgi:hypothetical protein